MSIVSKKYRLLLILLIGMVFAGKCQTSENDTICMKVSDVKKVLTAARQKQILDTVVINLNQQIDNLNAIISNYKDKDNALVKSYESQVSLLNEQKNNALKSITDLNKALRKERHKRFWTGVGGVAATLTVGFLYISK